MHVALLNAIFAEENRCPESRRREAPVAPRAGRTFMYEVRRTKFLRIVSHALGALCSMLCYYGVPRRISLGFAHSAAAAGNRRWGRRTQHVPVGKPFAFPVRSGCCTRILAELRDIAYIYGEIRMRQREADRHNAVNSHNSLVSLRK